MAESVNIGTAGSMPGNLVMPAVRAGSVALTVTVPAKVVVFTVPMPDNAYVVLLEYVGVPSITISARTAYGFMITGHVNATVGYVAVHFI
jgi:hypothetical protein